MVNLVPPREPCSVNHRAGRKSGPGAAAELHFDAEKNFEQTNLKNKKVMLKKLFRDVVFFRKIVFRKIFLVRVSI